MNVNRSDHGDESLKYDKDSLVRRALQRKLNRLNWSEEDYQHRSEMVESIFNVNLDSSYSETSLKNRKSMRRTSKEPPNMEVEKLISSL